MFNCPYSNDSFGPYSEAIPDGISTQMLQEISKQKGIYLIGGSIPERDDQNKLYNTCVVFGPDGKLLVKHRKVHLFDINVPGKIFFQESLTLSPGNSISVFDTPFGGKIGIAICYDIRFAELSMLTARQGYCYSHPTYFCFINTEKKKSCKMLCFPGAFNMTTGPLHWELLQRARAGKFGFDID